MSDSHGEVEFPDDLKKAIQEARSPLPDALRKLAGATGRFPEGKLNEADEGELQFIIGHSQGRVILEFNKPVRWIGFGRTQAIELVKALQAQMQYKQIG